MSNFVFNWEGKQIIIHKILDKTPGRDKVLNAILIKLIF